MLGKLVVAIIMFFAVPKMRRNDMFAGSLIALQYYYRGTLSEKRGLRVIKGLM